MSDKVINLPNKDDMLERLKAVDAGSHVVEQFYPILLKNAGQERVAQGVVMMLVLAIHDYAKGLPPMMSTLMMMNAPRYIDALVGDADVAQEAKDALAAALAPK